MHLLTTAGSVSLFQNVQIRLGIPSWTPPARSSAALYESSRGYNRNSVHQSRTIVIQLTISTKVHLTNFDVVIFFTCIRTEINDPLLFRTLTSHDRCPTLYMRWRTKQWSYDCIDYKRVLYTVCTLWVCSLHYGARLNNSRSVIKPLVTTPLGICQPMAHTLSRVLSSRWYFR